MDGRSLGVVALAVVTGIAGAQAAAEGAARPDLVVAAVHPAAGGGETLAVTATTVVNGPTRSASTTRFYLSRDRRRDARDVRLAGGRSSRNTRTTVTVTLRVPALVAPGEYFVIACADDLRRVRERNERNNCRASSQRTRIVQRFTESARNVTETLDLGRGTSQAVNETGATLTASAADGTRFTLTIPAEALREEVEITMTPLAAIADLGNAMRGAVTMEPAGLELNVPATLVVEPAAAIPLAEQSAFATRSGRDFHLHPTTLERTRIELPLVHFSTYGVWRTLEEERAAQERRVPSEREAWAIQNLARSIADLKAGRATPVQVDAASRVAFDVWALELIPHLQAAVSDADRFDLIGGELFAITRQYQLAGNDLAGWPLYRTMFALWKAGFANALERALDNCLRDPYEGTRLLSLLRQALLAGQEGPRGDAERALDNCLSFELTFDTTISWTLTDYATSVTATVGARAASLPLKPGALAVRDLEVTRYELSGTVPPSSHPCTQTGDVAEPIQPARVARVDLDVQRPRGSTRPRQVFLDFQPGAVLEWYLERCPLTGEKRASWAFYGQCFDALHAAANIGHAYRLLDWQQLSGSVWAIERRYAGSVTTSIGGDSVLTCSEDTRLVLRHAT